MKRTKYVTYVTGTLNTLFGVAVAAGYVGHAITTYDRAHLSAKAGIAMAMRYNQLSPLLKCTDSEKYETTKAAALLGAQDFMVPFRLMQNGYSDNVGVSLLNTLGDLSTMPFAVLGRVQGARAAFDHYCIGPDDAEGKEEPALPIPLPPRVPPRLKAPSNNL